MNHLRKFTIALLSLFINLTTAAGSVKNEKSPPKGYELTVLGFPVMAAIVVGSMLGLIILVCGVVYVFSQEDPSKTNLVYKLTHHRMKTE